MGQRIANLNNQQELLWNQGMELFGNQGFSSPTVPQQNHPVMIQMMATTTPVARHPHVGPRHGVAQSRQPNIINQR